MVSKTTRPMLVVKQAPTSPYKTVLVPVNFSAHSLRSIRHCRQAVAPGASLALLQCLRRCRVRRDDGNAAGACRPIQIQHYSQSPPEALESSRRCSSGGPGPVFTSTVVVCRDSSLLLQQEQERPI